MRTFFVVLQLYKSLVTTRPPFCYIQVISVGYRCSEIKLNTYVHPQRESKRIVLFKIKVIK